MSVRTRSAWPSVRRRSTDDLHALANRFRRDLVTADLTEGQERLWVQMVAELEWRSARSRRGYRRCACDLCRPPFPE